jgi:hypothetical protein
MTRNPKNLGERRSNAGDHHRARLSELRAD